MNHSAREVVAERRAGTNAIAGMFSRCRKILKEPGHPNAIQGQLRPVARRICLARSGAWSAQCPREQMAACSILAIGDWLQEVEDRRGSGEQEGAVCWQTLKEFSYFIPTIVAASG